MNIPSDKRIVYLDLETTSRNVNTAGICQIGTVMHADHDKKISVCFLVNPAPYKLTAAAKKVNGINEEKLKNKKTFDKVSRSFDSYLRDAYLVGWNLRRFDIPILVREFKRCGITFNPDQRNILDVLTLIRILFPDLKSYSLSNVYRHLFNEDFNAHNARADCHATQRIFESEEVQSSGLNLSLKTMRDWINFTFGEYKEYRDQAGYFAISSQNNTVFNSGRYTGEPVEQYPHLIFKYMSGNYPDDTRQVAAFLRQQLKGI